ncbi:MAG: histidine kinase dimerization/phospho-acceptor domain-containing protein, partial [Bacteroidota bacterium]
MRYFDLKDFDIEPGKHEDRFLSVREKGTMYEYILSPIEKKQACYRCHANLESIRGYFVVKVATSDLEAIALEHRTTNILMTIFSFGGVAGATFVALTWLVILPVRKLHSHIEHVEQQIGQLESGEQTVFPTLPAQHTKDEVADLSRAFNDLIRRLNDANDSLFRMHRGQLQEADRIATAGEMAASLAHEIKNPLAGVLGALQVFDSETREDDQRKELLAEMMSQLERINHAVNDLLSYARPTPPVFAELDINEMIKKTVFLLSQQLKDKALDIKLSPLNGNPIVAADQKMMQQLLWNISLNGLQAMGHSGTLTIRTSRENASLKIEVHDTGSG